MKTNRPVLEYCVTSPAGTKRATWGFRFRTPEGNMLLESTKSFPSKAQAERGFVSLIKSVAANQYTVEYQEKPANSFSHPTRFHRRSDLKVLKRTSRNRLLRHL